MDEDARDGLAQLRWGARKYLPLIVLAPLAVGAGSAAAIAERDADYVASALVVAQSNAVQLEVLPRLGDAVFNSGAVARSVADLPGLDVPADDVIPKLLTLTVQQDSITYTVTGHSDDAASATRIANIGADTFTRELNRPGAGVGSFAVQTPAEPPTGPTNAGPGVPIAFVAGALAGLLLALGIVVALLVVRRPVVAVSTLTDISKTPCLGTVTIRRSGNLGDVMTTSPGMVGLVRRLLAAQPRVVGVMSPVPSSRVSQRFMSLLSRAVAEGSNIAPSPDRRPVHHAVDVAVVTPADLVQEPSRGTCLVLAVPEGLRESALRRLTGDLVEGDLFGTVLVRPRRLFRAARVPGRGQTPHHKASRPAQEVVDPDALVPAREARASGTAL